MDLDFAISFGAIAQLVERVVRNDEVRGSIPLCSRLSGADSLADYSLILQIIATETITLDMEFTDVTVHAKANIYFEGRVISHTVILRDGERKTVGVILPGTYHFGTQQAEKMEIIEGESSVVLDRSEVTVRYANGEAFEVPANSGFTITVAGEPCHYICSFLG